MRFKQLFLAATTTAILVGTSFSQNTKGPTIHLSNHSDPALRGEPQWGNPPAMAAKLLFYGGDSNPDDPNVDAFANGNTLLQPDSTAYGAITVPKDSKVVVTGVFFAHVMLCYQNPTYACTGSLFDPATATYDIRIGVSDGNGGTDVAHGSGPQTATLTGRSLPFGIGVSLPEYYTSVAFTKLLVPVAGTTYFLNEAPQCTDANNENCIDGDYFADNTTEQTNGINPALQPPYQIFLEYPFIAYPWMNACDAIGGQSPACERLSYGIYGRW